MSVVVVVTAFPAPEHRAEVIAAFEAARPTRRLHGVCGPADASAVSGEACAG